MEKSNTVDKARVSIIVALGRDGQHNHVIGKNNELLWHIPDDLKHFKALTLGHPVIMGRKTFESLPPKARPLPERPNIVITRSTRYESANPLLALQEYSAPNVFLAGSIEEALGKARELNGEEIFIGGGTQIYEQALPFVDRLYLTLIDDEKEGDAYFPHYEKEFTKVISEESREWNGLKYTWVTLKRP
jgi:dihydrofolate reductase